MGKRVYRNIEIHGIVYPDANAAATALGMTAGHIRTSMRKGRLNGLGTRTAPRPVTIRGVTYSSFSAAGKALGVNSNTVRTAYRKGTLHRVGTGRVGVEPMRVRIAGQDFEDVATAAAYFGVQPGTVYSAISDGDPDRIARAPIYKPWRSRVFTIGSLSFPSMAAASRALGFKSDEFIAKALKQGSRRGRERILAAAMRYIKEGGQLEVG